MLLGVYLGADLVGEIVTSADRVEFRLTDAYRATYPRPVLGQVFEDDPDRVHRSRIKLPPFFSNLLPEGALRQMLARQLGSRVDDEPALLAYLGEDLPGAVRVVTEDGSREEEAGAPDAGEHEAPDALKFSLAGVQLKLSALRVDRGLTIPTHGVGGNWIVKLPDPRFPGVPENEWSMMTLARKAGLDVADVELVALGEIRGLPEGIAPSPDTLALAVRRFDRPDGARVHMEDFAQALDVRATTHREKYGAANFETIARIVARVAPASAEEFVRRLAFNVMIGNGDAHIKNWSLLYPDRIHPVLSPGYDLVSTVLYIPADDLGLNLARSKQFGDVTVESFARLQRKADLPFDAGATALGLVRRVREVWAEVRSALPLAESGKQAIEAHWGTVPLVRTA